MILVFCVFLGFSMIRGMQAVINLILALYLALLISLKFPYYTYFIGSEGDSSSDPIIMIAIFAAFTIVATFFFGRLMPTEFKETAFEAIGKKLVYSLLATILVMAYSYHALPVTDIITPGSPIQSLFGHEEHFFWWLILPIAGVFFL